MAVIPLLKHKKIAVPENTTRALEAQLAHRPDVQELVDRNIIKGKKMKKRKREMYSYTVIRSKGGSCYSTIP